MNKQESLLTSESAKSIVSGLILMSVATLIWTGVAYYGMRGTPHWWLLSVFPLACMFFIYYAWT